MHELIAVASDLLERGEDFVLARITNRQGSAPRTAGAWMIVRADGVISGTIGGGLLEAIAMEKSALVLKDGVSRFLAFDLNHEDISNMDMICGGAVEILLDGIRATEENSSFFAAWREIGNSRKPALFVTTVRESGGRIDRIDRCLMMPDGTVTGRFPLSGQAGEQVREAGFKPAAALSALSLENATVLVEPMARSKTVYIFGAGHVALPTAHMAAMMGFRVVVLDDREIFANAQRFPEADEIHVLNDFGQALEGLPIDEDSFIVILTRGHLHDKCVLARALKTRAGYIGMIGSRRKRDSIYKALLAEGVGDDDLARVFSPIGLSIGAETPEEISLSIVAELVQQRASRQGGWL